MSTKTMHTIARQLARAGYAVKKEAREPFQSDNRRRDCYRLTLVRSIPWRTVAGMPDGNATMCYLSITRIGVRIVGPGYTGQTYPLTIDGAYAAIIALREDIRGPHLRIIEQSLYVMSSGANAEYMAQKSSRLSDMMTELRSINEAMRVQLTNGGD